MKNEKKFSKPTKPEKSVRNELFFFFNERVRNELRRLSIIQIGSLNFIKTNYHAKKKKY